ncbi:MAG: VOC family protein [Chloroflexi bacterium]|nr:VOC family protein [Chloroflexota bacterium]
MSVEIHIDPRIRALGKARIDVTRRAKDEREWQMLWREPRYACPLRLGEGWRYCVEYSVEDFAAEIGFYIDVLGLPVSAFSTNYAQFTSPDAEFFFGVRAAAPDQPPAPAGAMRIQFQVQDLPRTVEALVRRGVSVSQAQPQSDRAIASFHSPNGAWIELWGEAHVEESAAPQGEEEAPPAKALVEAEPLLGEEWFSRAPLAAIAAQPAAQAEEAAEDTISAAAQAEEIVYEDIEDEEEEDEAEYEDIVKYASEARPAPTRLTPASALKGNGARNFPVRKQ